MLIESVTWLQLPFLYNTYLKLQFGCIGMQCLGGRADNGHFRVIVP